MSNSMVSIPFNPGVLPKLALISLPGASAITLSGEDSVTFLQGQVTCDVTTLGTKQMLLGAHCSPKGKTWSVFRLVNVRSDLCLLCNTDAKDASLVELKKYGVFSKTEITDAGERFVQLGLVGESAKQAVVSLFGAAPDSEAPVLPVEQGVVIFLDTPLPRYLLVLEKEQASIVDALSAEQAPEAMWEQLEIAAGLPQLAKPHLDEYVPQMLNLQALDAISFSKGCYSGQETIARMRYLGRNKRALFRLTGSVSDPVQLDDELEMQLGESWRRAGKVIRLVQQQQQIELLAVLPNDIDRTSVLRVKNQPESQLRIAALPYELSE